MNNKQVSELEYDLSGIEVARDSLSYYVLTFLEKLHTLSKSNDFEEIKKTLYQIENIVKLTQIIDYALLNSIENIREILEVEYLEQNEMVKEKTI